MSKVVENLLTEGLSGKYSNKIVFRQRYGKTIFAKKPRNYRPSPVHQANRENFLAAVDYALGVMNNPEKKEVYRQLAPIGVTAYNMAIADFLSEPKIERIDVNQYTGQIGDPVSVVAIDKCKVVSVHVKILDPGGNIVEQGPAVQVTGGRMWMYLAAALNTSPIGSTVNVTATDMVDHSAEASALV